MFKRIFKVYIIHDFQGCFYVSHSHSNNITYKGFFSNLLVNLTALMAGKLRQEGAGECAGGEAGVRGIAVVEGVREVRGRILRRDSVARRQNLLQLAQADVFGLC